VPLLSLADEVVPWTPPAREPSVIAAALAGNHEDVTVRRLAETLVRPDGDGVVAVEVAKDSASGLVRAV